MPIHDEPSANHPLLLVLGGNAFVSPGEPLTMAGQFRFAENLFDRLMPILRVRSKVVITHGNGPQVGHLLTRVEEALGKAYAVPLEVCVAESEGELGYVLQQALYNALVRARLPRPLVSVLTQVVVDAHDPAFASPSKPVGDFYSAAQAAAMQARGFQLREDAGRGYRRVVASPRPRRIVEVGVIRRLLDDNVLVICAGGGGIPVVEREGQLMGVEAVVDKDFSSAMLGTALDAREMLILTGVPCAYRNFGSRDQVPLERLTPDEARQQISAGEFAVGSMLPKVEAALQFVARPDCRAIISDPEHACQALAGKAGTQIVSA